MLFGHMGCAGTLGWELNGPHSLVAGRARHAEYEQSPCVGGEMAMSVGMADVKGPCVLGAGRGRWTDTLCVLAALVDPDGK